MTEDKAEGAIARPLSETERTIAHCWEEGPKQWFPVEGEFWGREETSTCMLPDGHAGPHDWTPDDSIGLIFARSPVSSDDE